MSAECFNEQGCSPVQIFSKEGRMMKTRSLTVLAVCVVLLTIPGFPAFTKDQQTDRSELLQFTAGGHVIGFQKDRFYLATGTHALCVEFAGTSQV